VKISPSLLACDFARLAEEIRRSEAAGADWLHVDVMDGHFVPNLTVGPSVVRSVKRAARVPLDVHLMIAEPAKYVAAFVEAGSDYLTIHAESEGDTAALLEEIRRLGAKPGLTVRPGTDLSSFEACGDLIDLALVMAVEPGFGGQTFMPESLARIRALRGMLGERVEIAVDGGVTVDNAKAIGDAGASVLVAGTAVFGAPDIAAAVAALRGDACGA